MPGCAAVGCNNRSEKGYIMKCFPRDPKLRKIWQERVARADWEPSNNSFLCHVHFVPQAWSITKSGRIRLKKNAIPSIFVITSTRKSPKKRIKTPIAKKESVSQNEYIIDYLENDTEYSSTGHLDEKDSDFHGIDESSIQFIEQKKLSQFSKSVKAEDRIHSGDQGENILLLINDRMVETPSVEMELNDNGEEATNVISKNSISSQVSNSIDKKEVKLGIMDSQSFNDSYDEIEERLKQICDGGSSEDDNYDKTGDAHALPTKNRKEIKAKSEMNCDSNTAEMALPVNTNHNFLMKHEMGHILADKRENVEIIFGAESGDESTTTHQTASYKQSVTRTKVTDDNGLEDDESTKDELKVFNEDIEENFTKDEVHVIPNIRAAMKRKRRTREEIMKSIKKSIRSTSDLELKSSSNSELSDSNSIDNETESRNELTVSLPEIIDVTSGDTNAEAAKFVIKVTGDPDDVTEIIGDLSSNTMATQVSEKNSAACTDQENEEFVTSIITILSSHISKTIPDNTDLDDYTGSRNNIINQSIEKGLENLEFVHSPDQCQPLYSRRSVSWSDEEDRNQLTTIKSQRTNCTHSADASLGNKSTCCDAYDYEELIQRVKIQEDVIAKLTDQLIIYKELENNIRSKSVEREVQTTEVENMTNRVNTRSSNVQSLVVNKKNLESKQRLIEDLSNRVNYFEEMNKKLMKTVTLESQYKRKLEGQMKQKDTRIKELNWKLEKAAKYLERAEKNTNTYRRKMLNMQTVIKRKKLLDEKLSNFNDMLIDSSTQEYTERALSMAADIRKICGRHGYDKLLSYGFPLPPLPALRKGIFSEECTDYNESDIDGAWNTKSADKSITTGIKNKKRTNKKDSQMQDTATKASEFDCAETVTGTVQDIFDENNDGDDFSTNELREHFILQLNAVM